MKKEPSLYLRLSGGNDPLYNERENFCHLTQVISVSEDELHQSELILKEQTLYY